MMFKTVLFGGFLFATLCAAADKPRMASLEVMPNLDQSLTYRDFRVHYPGAGEGFISSGETVSIKIYVKNGRDALITYDIPVGEENAPNAYYFGKSDAADGDYEVDVCAGNKCSGRSPALTQMRDQRKEAVTCEKGKEEIGVNGVKTWSVTEMIKLDVIGTDKLFDDDKMQKIAQQSSKFQFDWKKYGIVKNPSYKKLAEGQVLYVAAEFDIAHYRKIFLSKGVENNNNGDDSYAHEFCERKYLLSGHVHLIKKDTNEVKYRFKKTLYLTEEGKQLYIIGNTAEDPNSRRKVPVELAFTDTAIKEGFYDIWISFCATEKDKNDSTVCSIPFISANFEVKDE